MKNMKNISVKNTIKNQFDNFQRRLAVSLDKKLTATDTIEWLLLKGDSALILMDESR